MMYKVGILEGYSPATGEVLDTNGITTFSYKNYLGEDTDGEFPIPRVTVGGGAILVHWYQVNSKGEPINELGQTVEGPAYAKQVSPQSILRLTIQPASATTHRTPLQRPILQIITTTAATLSTTAVSPSAMRQP